MKLIKILLLLATVVSTFSCAHKITTTPDLAHISSSSTIESHRINANVGYYVPSNMTNLQVITPGGGGDRVKYYPYKEIEMGYQVMLGTIFERVVKLNYIDSNSTGVQYVIEPYLITNSGSDSFMTWPPTTFSVDLTSKVSDPSGQELASPRVVGYGTATFSEFIKDKGLAGKRAMEDALLKMQTALRGVKFNDFRIKASNSNKDNTTMTQTSKITQDETPNRLNKIKELYNQGLLTKEEYQQKRAQIIDNL